jgi:hypothetical protein
MQFTYETSQQTNASPSEKKKLIYPVTKVSIYIPLYPKITPKAHRLSLTSLSIFISLSIVSIPIGIVYSLAYS